MVRTSFQLYRIAGPGAQTFGPTFPLFGKGHSLIFYRKFIRDYRDDTRQLSFLEHGAYNLLLDELYHSEKPIPNDDTVIRRLLGAVSEEEFFAINRILNRFFIKTRFGWTHKRFREELKHVESRASIARDNGKKGGRPAGNKPRNNPAGYFQETQTEPTEKATPRHTDSFPQSESVSVGAAAASLQGNGNGAAAAAEIFRASATEIRESFHAIDAQPFGGLVFQSIFARTVLGGYKGAGGFADVMEAAILVSKQHGIKVPGRFYTIKRRVEEVESKNSFRSTPL